MKSILVPTDFSEVANPAITSAVSFAKKFNSEIILLHVVKKLDNQADEKLQELKDSSIFEGLSVKIELRQGDPIEEISEFETDLIIIGAYELTGIIGLFTSSTAIKVAKRAKCPVITVKHHTDFSQINSLVYATDMKPEQVDLLDDIKVLQEMYHAHLHIVKVFGGEFEIKEDVEKRLKNFADFNKLEDYSVTALEGIDEADAILKFANKMGSQMIMMATHDWSGIGKLLGGFISSEILKESKIAVWSKSLDQ